MKRFLFIFPLLTLQLLSQTTFEGEQILKASETTVDIFDSFLGILSSNALHNEAVSFFGVNFRNAPGKFLLSDSTQEDGGLTRIQFAFGSGTGKDLSKGSLFYGMTIDNVTSVEKGEITKGPSKFVQSTSFQAILYAGFASGDMQVAYGYVDKGSLNGLNSQNQFVRENGSLKGTDLSSGHMVTLYHSAGAFFSLSGSTARKYDHVQKLWNETENVAEVRFHLQPLKQYLPRVYGLPFLSVEKLSRYKQYFGQTLEQIKGVTQQAQQVTQNYVLPAYEILKKDPYELTVGSDDMVWISEMNDLRFRVSSRIRVYPEFKFRRAEIAGSWKVSDFLSAGLRGEAYKGYEWNSSFDSYLLLGNYGLFQYGISYSYNSSDGTTFLPIPKAHVFGLQVIYGFPEMIKPLIPIVRGLDDKERRKRSRD